MPDPQSRPIDVWFATDALPIADAVAFAQRVEALGYGRLWVAETFGRDPFTHLAHLAAHTETLGIATGIANVYHRHAGPMRQAANTLAESSGGRFTLGLGVSSPQIVERGRGIPYSKPLSYLKDYLDAYDKALYLAVPPEHEPQIVLAALGPKMVALAAERSAGAHTYNVTPEHTAWTRKTLGDGPELVVEQKVMLCTDPDLARATGAKVLKFYAKAPGYRAAWLRLGITEEEIDSFADRFVDALVAHGDAAALQTRVEEHFAAGATRVAIHPIDAVAGFGSPDMAALEALAPTT